MKKIILLFGILLISGLTMNSQETSNNTIGLRFGGGGGGLGTEVTYQRSLGDSNRLEAGLSWRGASYYNAIKITGLYQWVWDLEGNFNWYAGAGGGFGSWNVKSDYFGDGVGGTYVFAAGDVGIEYNFDFPLLLSLDFRPEIGFSDFNSYGYDIGLGVRYQFD